jgi:hypothetical protein
MARTDENTSEYQTGLVYARAFKTGVWYQDYEDSTDENERRWAVVAILWQLLFRFVVGIVIVSWLAPEWHESSVPDYSKDVFDEIRLRQFAAQSYGDDVNDMFLAVPFLLATVYAFVNTVNGIFVRPDKHAYLSPRNISCVPDCPSLCDIIWRVVFTILVFVFASLLLRQYKDRLTFFRIVIVFWILYHSVVLVPRFADVLGKDYSFAIVSHEKYYTRAPVILLIIHWLTGVVLLFMDVQMDFIARESEHPRQPLAILLVLSYGCLVAYVLFPFILLLYSGISLCMDFTGSFVILLMVFFTRYGIPAMFFAVFQFVFIQDYYTAHQDEYDCGDGYTADCRSCPEDSLAAEIFRKKLQYDQGSIMPDVAIQDCFSHDHNVMSLGEYRPLAVAFPLLIGAYLIISSFFYLLTGVCIWCILKPVGEKDDPNSTSRSAIGTVRPLSTEPYMPLRGTDEVEHHAGKVVVEWTGLHEIGEVAYPDAEQPVCNANTCESEKEHLHYQVHPEDGTTEMHEPPDGGEPAIQNSEGLENEDIQDVVDEPHGFEDPYKHQSDTFAHGPH